MLMQAKPGMQTLRTICARKHLHLLDSQSIPSRPNLYFSRFSPNLKRFIHSTNQLYSEESSSIPAGIRGWRIPSSEKPSSEPEENPNDDTKKTESISSHRNQGWSNSSSEKPSSEPEENPNNDTTKTESISSHGNQGWKNSSSEKPRAEPKEIPNNYTKKTESRSYHINPNSEEEPDLKEDNPYAGRFTGQILKGGWSKKPVTTYVCSYCGNSDGQWWGFCHSCNKAGTFQKFVSRAPSESRVSRVSRVSSGSLSRTWLSQHSINNKPLRLNDVKNDMKADWRFPLSGLLGSEVGKVLGGGLVPGSLILIGGDPGVGKSTLMLQLAAIISEGDGMGAPAPVVYVSGEESVEQIGNRADRLGIRTEKLFLYSSTDVQDILRKTEALSPRALIVDSIQTVYHTDVVGTAGGVTQVKECTSVLMRFAKDRSVPVLLTGHVTKTGEIAGPRVLEHIVDTVLYLEGDKHTSYRMLRTAKNRFGSSDELGVLEMSHSGLQAVSNPSEIYLSGLHEDSDRLAGLAITVVIDASHSFVIEIQALCLTSASSLTKKEVNGAVRSRANMIVAVLTEQAGLKLQETAVFINVVGGYDLKDTGGDLAIAAAIASSCLELPIPQGVAFIGEVGLSGELRPVSRMEKRVNTVAQMGYKMCIVPQASVKSMSAAIMDNAMKVVGCCNLKEVITTVFPVQ